jgi:hypothetical protein
MIRSDFYVSRIAMYWAVVPAYVREALARAETLISDAWHEDSTTGRGELGTTGSIQVWRDMLAFSASSWDTVAAPPVAAHAMPPGLVEGLLFFYCPNVLPCAEPADDLRNFRAMTNPGSRRACLLAAMDAMYGVFNNRRIGQPPTWGWDWVLPRMPPEAKYWLQKKSQQWPARWRAGFECWWPEKGKDADSSAVSTMTI